MRQWLSIPRIHFSFVFVLTGGGEKCRSRNNPFGLPEKKMYPDFGVGLGKGDSGDSFSRLMSFSSDCERL